MSAAENTILSADAYVQEMLRAAEAHTDIQSGPAALNRRAFLKLVGVAGGGLALAFYIGDRATALANTNGSEHERVGAPFRCTVHAPHWPIPQPYFVPTSPR